ncbi:MAG: hypothetical protein GYB64_17050 [Chloroflexi bacterium]|nr:hypothetical protein [Chloroflexota bacterium]
MRPLTDKDLDRNRHLFMFDDETVMDLVRAVRDEDAQDWWHLVVDLEEGGYAVARVSDVTAALNEQGEDLLGTRLAELVGVVLKPVETTVEMAGTDYRALRDEAYQTKSKVAVVLQDGAYRGIVTAGGSRSGGAFDAGLVAMAGQYAEIPEEGLLSPRRKKHKSKQKK